eukprot:gene29011-37422_t
MAGIAAALPPLPDAGAARLARALDRTDIDPRDAAQRRAAACATRDALLALDADWLPLASAPGNDDALYLELDGWEGPLDLLLDLARRQKVDLRTISILDLVDQYLGYVNRAQALRLELAADYLVMAAWLAYLKSLLLLPRDPEMQPSPEELALRLQLRLQRLGAMREAASRLMARDRLGRDVIEVLDSLEIKQAHFCGLSMGGWIGQWLAVHAPDRIGRLILSNTAAHLGPPSSFDAQIRAVLAVKDMSDTADQFMRNWFPASMLAGPNEIVDTFRAMVLATPPRGLAGCFAALRDNDLRRTIALIKAPTLVIGGVDDKVTLASHSEEIAATIPGAKLVLMPGVHMLNVERPTEFLGARLDRVDGLWPSTRS